jgi:hypothetical protein
VPLNVSQLCRELPISIITVKIHHQRRLFSVFPAWKS